MGESNRYRTGPRSVKFYIDRKIGEHAEELGLSASTAQFLNAIRDNEGVSMKDLSAILSVDKSLTTRSVRALMELGLVEDIYTDSHRYGLKLTEPGIEKADEIQKLLDGIWASLFRYLIPEEIETFKNISKKILRAVNEDMYGAE